MLFLVREWPGARQLWPGEYGTPRCAAHPHHTHVSRWTGYLFDYCLYLHCFSSVPFHSLEAFSKLWLYTAKLCLFT